MSESFSARTRSSMLAFGLRRSISLRVVSHWSNASRWLDKDTSGSSGSETPQRIVRVVSWVIGESVTSLFTW